jgi:multidrug efflux pump subunit AcrA (membrane-fusion protein)
VRDITMMNIKKITALILTAVFFAFTAGGCAAEDPTPQVTTAAVQKQAIETEVNISGILLPQNTVSISSKLASTALTVNAEIGAAVKKGDTLITLDTKQIMAQLKQAEAALKQASAAVKTAKSSASSASNAVKVVEGNTETAKINLDAAKAAYSSAKSLYQAGLATEADVAAAKVKYEVAKSQYDTLNGPTTKQAKYSSSAAGGNVNTAQAAVAVAEANVASLSVQLENATITSPVDGIIATRSINVGELAGMGAPLLTIIEADTLKLKGTVSQSMLPLLSEGQEVEAAVDIYPERKFAGRISLIAPMAVTTGEYFPIEISIPNEEGLKPGLSARALIRVKSAEHLTVPVSALVNDQGQYFVYIADNGIAKKQAVTAGIKNSSAVEILSGLSEGQEVITSHTDILADQMPVRK